MTFAQNPELFTVIFIVTIEIALIILCGINKIWNKTLLPEIAFDEPCLVWMSIDFLDGARFLVTFQFDIYGTYHVPKGENLSYFDVDCRARKIVFERCECKL